MVVMHQVIRKHINHWDPEHLLEGGAPDDEYEDEIKEILNGMLVSRDTIEIAEVIKDTFDRAFCSEYDYKNCLIVAQKIWEELYE